MDKDGRGSDGEVWIKRQDGQTFVIRPEPKSGSPLDVEGVDLGLTAEEIVDFVHEGGVIADAAEK